MRPVSIERQLVPIALCLCGRTAARPARPRAGVAFMTSTFSGEDPGTHSSSRSQPRRRNSEPTRNRTVSIGCISDLLDDQVDGGRKARPVRQFLFQLIPSGTCERVELCHAAGLRRTPCRFDPCLLLQTVEGRIERALLDLERFLRNLLDAFGNRPAMLRFDAKSLENQQIEGSLDEISGFSHIPRSSTIVDALDVFRLGCFPE